MQHKNFCEMHIAQKPHLVSLVVMHRNGVWGARSARQNVLSKVTIIQILNNLQALAVVSSAKVSNSTPLSFATDSAT